MRDPNAGTGDGRPDSSLVRGEIHRLLERARATIMSAPDAAQAAAEEARTRAQAAREHWLQVKSLIMLAEACRAAGAVSRAAECALEGLGLALAFHDVESEQAALELLREQGSGARGISDSSEQPPGPAGGGRYAAGGTETGDNAILDAYALLGYSVAGEQYRALMPIATERRPLLERALEFTTSRASADSLHEGDHLLSIGALCREQGDNERSIEYPSRALNEFERSGDRSGLAACYGNIGESYLRRGRYERALQVFDTVLAAEAGGVAPEPVLTALGFAAEACLRTGDFARGRDSCDRGLALARETRNQVEQSRALVRKAELLTVTGELSEAAGLLREALPLTISSGLPYLEACAQRVAARLLAAREQPEPARACFEAAAATLAKLDRRPELARTLSDSGRYLWSAQAQAPSASREQLGRAVELFRAMEAGSESLEIERYLVQHDTHQDRRLLVLKSLSSLVTQLLPVDDFVRRSLDLLRDALKCPHGTFYLSMNQQFLGDSPEDWESEVSPLGSQQVKPHVNRDEVRAACEKGEALVSPSLVCVPLRVAGRSIGSVCLQGCADPGLPMDNSFRETLGSLLAMGLANGLESEAGPAGGAASTARHRTTPRYPGIVGTGRAMQEVYELVERVAPTSANVLIRGESGTGKELVARVIHQRSLRAGRPFLAMNCAAIPEALLESELFGIEKGVASGVAARVGKFELANGGTLFLDEIGDVGPPLQAKLLRVLQSRTFERVGGRGTIDVDVRVIAATNRDLEQGMADGKFRQDLYYRLNVMTIVLPPLRKRREDLPLLVSHFLQKYNQEFGRQTGGVASDVMALFQCHPWPGNVRELENLIERAVILCSTETIRIADLPVTFQDFARENPEPLPAESRVEPASAGSPRELWQLRKRARDQATVELELKLVSGAIERSRGNVAKAARELGVSRAQLYRLMDRHGLRKKQPA